MPCVVAHKWVCCQTCAVLQALSEVQSVGYGGDAKRSGGGNYDVAYILDEDLVALLLRGKTGGSISHVTYGTAAFTACSFSMIKDM